MAPDNEVARVFTAVAADYDRSGVDFFRVFAARLVETLDPQPDWHLLDLGSGRGAVVFELTERAESPLRITAVDVAPGMVELLRADVAAAGLEAVSVQLADIENLEVADASVDAVTASMVLFFLPDLSAGLREIRRVLRPQGMLAFSVFGPSDPQWTDVYEAFLPFLPGQPGRRGDLSRPRHPGLADPEAIAGTLETAGFREVRSEQIVHAIDFDSVEQWHTWSWSIGLRGAWLSIPEEARPRARTAVLNKVAHRLQADGRLMERFAVEYVTAKR